MHTIGGHSLSVDSSLVTVGAACLFGISLALRAELKDHDYRVNEVGHLRELESESNLVLLPRPQICKRSNNMSATNPISNRVSNMTF